jgi:hypothetical protein
MKPLPQQIPSIVPLGDEHARMMAYARSEEGRTKIAKAKAEIAAGKGIVVDGAYFDDLDRRIAARVAKRHTAGK